MIQVTRQLLFITTVKLISFALYFIKIKLNYFSEITAGRRRRLFL
ncbi:hypothetical protein HMPREF9086_0745 [Enterobacter hormaechei ATCC 49162]|nr:hypothetical protein HMPREF9086_0745 [Enterobacter hormaechei ATCC 49162]